MTLPPGDRSASQAPEPSRRRWVVLAAGLSGQIAACSFQYGLPFLVPSFRAAGLTLTQAGALVSAPVFGVLCALVLWGAVADRVGERWVLAAGLTGAAAALAVAAALTSHPLVLAPVLFVAGASAACVHVVSGRLILGWFPVHERGLAMGLRQTGQPLGVAVAALSLPQLGARSVAPAMLWLAGGCALAAVLIVAGVRDVHRPADRPAATAASPYRGGYLWRVHAAGALMVVPQFGVAVFAFDYLVSDQGWGAGSAGTLLAVAQVFGAGSRLGAGWWSDRAGSRLRPMRAICLATALVLLALASGAAAGWALAVAALVAASVITVSTNGLSFTAVAERAGQSWAGRALGVHNTGQNLTAALTPPLIAMVVTAGGHGAGLQAAGQAATGQAATGQAASGHGYALAFSCLVIFPVAAACCLPVARERTRERAGYTEPAVALESKPGSH